MVLKGSHCRLSNITLEGTWKEDEEFKYCGQLVKRYAGKSAGQCMKQLVELRRNGSEEQKKIIAGIEWYQQPGAVVDGITRGWQVEEEMQRWKCSISSRDALQCQQIGEIKLRHAAANQMQHIVKPQTTALVQLTDTDYS